MLAVTAAMLTCGCSSDLGRKIPVWAGGEPAGLPMPPPQPAIYPDVDAQPPSRPVKLISEQEQARLEAELSALRDKVSAQGAAVQQERDAEQARERALEARGARQRELREQE